MTNKTVTICAGWGRKTTETLTIDDNGLGVIDGAARRAFMRGQCHALAIALHQITGWTIKGVGDSKFSPSHCVVYASELKAYIDIRGASKTTPRLNGCRVGIVNRRISVKTAKSGLDGYLRPNIRAAMPFAKTIVRMVKQSG